MIIRWISDVPSKMVKIRPFWCHARVSGRKAARYAC
jgi:hypothetical protein